MRVRYVGQDKAAVGWCDHCGELAEFMVDEGISNVGVKRLCPAHAEELHEELSKVLFQRRVVVWKTHEKARVPRRSG